MNRGQPPATRKASTPAVLPNQIPVETSELIDFIFIWINLELLICFGFITYCSLHQKHVDIAQVLQILLLDLLAAQVNSRTLIKIS